MSTSPDRSEEIRLLRPWRPSRMLRRVSPQRLLFGGLVLAVVIAAARFLAIQGWIRPVRIVSGSMVYRLIGEHYVVTCADCEFVFQFGVESPPPLDRAVCPNCGYERNIPLREWRGRGDRVMIDRAAYLFEPFRRFDLVAFRDPRMPVRMVVKRVIGLPNEQVAIRHGDVYIDGKLLRKSVKEFARMAILVHDNSKSPQPARLLPTRWRSNSDESKWVAEQSGFRFRGRDGTQAPTETGEPDWLTYHHWRCYGNSYPRSAEAPVSDNYGYNQGESRELREVVDLVLNFQLRLPGGK